MNFDIITKDYEQLYPAAFVLKDNKHRDKYTKTAMNEFASKNRKFSEIPIENIWAKKLLSNLNKYNENDNDNSDNPNSYEVKVRNTKVQIRQCFTYSTYFKQ